MTARSSRTAVITGMGALNAAGPDAEAVWAGVRAGRRALSPITRVPAGELPVQVAGEITDFDNTLVPRRFRAKTDRFTQFAFVAVDGALAGAGLGPDTLDPARTGVWFGNNTGGWDLCEQGFREYYEDGADVVNPWQATAWFLAAPQGFLTIRHGLRGMSKSFSGDRASGAVALHHAVRAVVHGRVDTVVAGGCEAPITPLSLVCHHANGEMSEGDDPETAYRPFDERPPGIVVGEGAAALIVEDELGADRRGATVHARILGGAHGTAIVDPPRTYAAVIGRALAAAACDPTDIDLVLADGAGHGEADHIELAALDLVFDGTPPVAAAVPKASFGHLYGGSFATDVVCGCLAARDGVVPATPQPTGAARGTALRFAPEERHQPVRRVLVCVRSRYGSCVALVLERP
jgi:3-oxoacyl-[acyl-carrier-protein] synthase II